MDSIYPLFQEWSARFVQIPMFPVLQCVHFTIVSLKLRMKLGTGFAQSNPLACWISAVISNFAGSFLISFFLGLPMVLPLKDVRAVAAMTTIWYLVFYCPFDIFNKFFMLQPAWLSLVVLKEAHRAKAILGGVSMGLEHYPTDLLVVVLVGIFKGAGALLVQPVAAVVQGSLDVTSHEALKPSFTTKASIVASILYTLVLKGIISISTECLCFGVFLVFALIKVSLHVMDAQDPFLHVEKALSPFCFGSPKETASTSDSKKKKE
ncbi:predicted protein [Nematostella vectensis]|uniref:Trimeric intracellular cation channel type B n=2 Tax=Nematostella vectensis TaxID=45351 RepID=A7SYB0_NEMVE|nr:predicted protein [Nematostella vectensis]|eukprot:XP_001623406.1 predicted protein [Nematostella vectensis]